jgi:drug/metabolite transporter (DMT)-like permease
MQYVISIAGVVLSLVASVGFGVGMLLSHSRKSVSSKRLQFNGTNVYEIVNDVVKTTAFEHEQLDVIKKQLARFQNAPMTVFFYEGNVMEGKEAAAEKDAPLPFAPEAEATFGLICALSALLLATNVYYLSSKHASRRTAHMISFGAWCLVAGVFFVLTKWTNVLDKRKSMHWVIGIISVLIIVFILVSVLWVRTLKDGEQ